MHRRRRGVQAFPSQVEVRGPSFPRTLERRAEKEGLASSSQRVAVTAAEATFEWGWRHNSYSSAPFEHGMTSYRGYRFSIFEAAPYISKLNLIPDYASPIWPCLSRIGQKTPTRISFFTFAKCHVLFNARQAKQSAIHYLDKTHNPIIGISQHESFGLWGKLNIKIAALLLAILLASLTHNHWIFLWFFLENSKSYQKVKLK